VSAVSRAVLRQTLPADAVVGSLSSLLGYRRYRVFSLPWLCGRMLYLGGLIGALALLSLFGTWASTGHIGFALSSAGSFLFGLLLMMFAGPSAATWVRHRGWTALAERVGVPVALVIGMAIGFTVESLVMARLEPLVMRQLAETGLLPPDQLAQAKQMGSSVSAVVVDLLMTLAMYFFLGGGIALLSYYGEAGRLAQCQLRRELAQLQERSQQRALKLGVLQAQIEPHFLFNTLASIRSLLRQDPARAEQTLDALSDHLRTTMPKLDGDMPTTTLGQQLDICASYLELMRLRLADRLSFAIEVSDSDRERPFLPLLLITLVENAVKHGIEPQPGPGHIQIQVRTAEIDGAARWEVQVVDNGAGLHEGDGSGVGLANVRAQLATHYGDRAGLQIEAQTGGGVAAKIWIAQAE